MKIIAKVPTKLKKAPVDSAFLAASEVVSVNAGKTFGVVSAIAAKNGHTEVTLGYGAGVWFVFNQHWDGLNPQVISKATAEYVFNTEISDALLADLNSCLNRYEINTSQRLRHFLSQIAHESGGLRWLQELATGDDYEGRDDLGNTQPGDGRRFKGAGVIQLTGRSNYQAFSKEIADPRVMEGVNYVAAKYPFTSAGFFWSRNSINDVIDRGGDVYAITRIVNGGLNGIEDRIYYYDRACNVVCPLGLRR